MIIKPVKPLEPQLQVIAPEWWVPKLGASIVIGAFGPLKIIEVLGSNGCRIEFENKTTAIVFAQRPRGGAGGFGSKNS